VYITKGPKESKRPYIKKRKLLAAGAEFDRLLMGPAEEQKKNKGKRGTIRVKVQDH
jgi:hypothetical protein